MSGETEKQVSAWTTDSLKEHIEALLREQDRRMQVSLDEHEKATLAAVDTIRAAVTKAETAYDRRFDSVNEFRDQLNDQAATFMPRHEAESRIHALEQRTEEGLLASKASVEQLRSTLERSSFVTRELFDNFVKEQGSVHERIFAQTSAIYSDLSNIKGRNAAYTVAIGLVFAILAVVLKFL